MRWQKIIKLPEEFSCPIPLGHGMYSTVYRAYQKTLDRIVAVKIYEMNRGVSSKICSEAQVLAGIKIPCVPAFYDIIQQRKSTILVMEWIRGLPLDQFCSFCSDMNFRKMAAIGLIKAVAMVHKQGIAHRDLKPENIIIGPDATVFLVDFGFAADAVRHEFSSEKIIGTPQFMAPELWNCSDRIDYQKSDLYALGTILVQNFGINLAAGLDDILDPNPQKRPDACEFLMLWERHEFIPDLDLQYKKQISCFTAEFLSSKYFETAKILFAQKEIRDAYEVIAEVLDEMPDHADALILLQSMQQNRNINKGWPNLIIGISAVLVVFLFFLAYQLGRHIEEFSSDTFLMVGNKAVRDSLLGFVTSAAVVSGVCPMKNDLGLSLAEGELCCLVPQKKGFLCVDGIPLKSGFYAKNCFVFNLTQGFHSIQWVDSSSEQTISEMVRILPFEKKKIRLFLPEVSH